MLVMYYSSLCFHFLKLEIMPEFKPTYWMLENHKDKGGSAWEVYSECVREAMARRSGM